MTALLSSYPKYTDQTINDKSLYKTHLDNALKHFYKVANLFAPHADIVFEFRPSDVSAANDTISNADHGLLLNDVIRFTTTGTLPAGLSPATDYHIISGSLTDGVFKVSTSQGGGAVDITDQGSGIHTATLTSTMTMRLGRGSIPVSDSLSTDVAVQACSTLTAPSGNPRKDLVTVDKSTGALTVTTGAEAASPSVPSVPSGEIPISVINLTVGMTEIVNSDIEDIRVLSLLPGTISSITDNGNAEAMVISADEEITMPKQPCFGAHLSSQQSNVTGNGTTYTATGAIWTELFDQNADFSNGTFTAPVTGKYLFTFYQQIIDITAAATTGRVDLVLTARTHRILEFGDLGAESPQVTLQGSIIVDMAASDTAHLAFTNSGETSDRHDFSGQNIRSHFGGCLLA